jgi:hypothetical protein
VLSPDGRTRLPPRDGRYRTALRESLGVLERRFGLSLFPAALAEAPLTAYPVRDSRAPR